MHFRPTWILLLTLLGCGGRTSTPTVTETTIVTSFDAIRLAVQPLAGDLTVRTLLPPGTSPHAYSPKPSEARLMQEAALVIHAHADIDGWVADLAQGKAYPMFSGEDTQGSEEKAQTDHGKDDHQDAHYWTDPVAVSRSLQPLATALCSADPADCPAIRRRATVLRARVDSLHRHLEQLSAERESACIISSEPFADRMLVRYGIPHVGPLRISADVPPTPTRMTRIIQEANDLGCRRMLVQSAFENRMERRLSAEQGWEIVEVDPLGAAAPDLLTYLSDLFDALTQSPAPDQP